MTQSDRKQFVLISEVVKTPLGDFNLITDKNGILWAADFIACELRMRRLLDNRLGCKWYQLSSGSMPNTIKSAVVAYFDGDIRAIDTIQFAGSGTTFQRSVWNAVRAIAPGSPVTYGDLASKLGQAGSARAVGLANAANPFCIIVPCHRVVGVNGALTGYSGGIERKRWLLDHESARK